MPASDATTWLAETKLHPPLVRDDTIARPRLQDALKRSVSALPLTLLSAPAGYGKTTMLASIPHLLPGYPLAWVTLDTEDNDPTRFIGLIALALQRLHPACGQSVWALLAGGAAEGAGLKRAVSALINDIAQHLPAPFVLVLDDLHFVTDPAVYLALEYLLDHQPPQLHIAVGTRHDPPLRLTRLAARRQLAELRRPDLGFSADEARQLLNDTLDLRLSETEVTAIQERTEGWPAGLCLLAGPLARMGTPADRSQFMAALNHSERYALDFLAEEVLRDLPTDQRLFLLRTAILAEMTPAVCRAVTGRDDADEVLEGLYRQNLTIASLTADVDGETVYRHHALFVRLLMRQLERELPGEITELHLRAAAAQRTPGRAVAHYLAAGSWESVVRIMLQTGMDLLRHGMYETVRTWHASLPEEVRQANPRLAVLMARCEIHRGDYPAAGALLRQARAAFVASGDAAGEGDAVASLITLSYQDNDRSAMAALVERARQLPLSPLGQTSAHLAGAWLHMATCDWSAARADVIAALAIPHATGDRRADLVGIAYMSAPLAAVPGCLESTVQYCTEASELSSPNTAWRLGADELLAWPLLWRGQLAAAAARAEAAEAIRQRLGGYPFVGNDAPVVLCALALAKGDGAAATQAVEALAQRIAGAAHGKANFYLHAAGRAFAELGRVADAWAMHQRLVDLADGTPLTSYLTDHLAGHIALLEGKLDDAATPLARAAELEPRLPVANASGNARLLQARLAIERQQPDAALALAVPVISAWVAAGTPGHAITAGPVIVPVLRLAAERGEADAAPLLAMFGQVVPVAAPAQPSAKTATTAATVTTVPLQDPLTQREIDVLRLIVAGRTNRQIGEELFISEETVKSHVVHILRKLDVTSRTQAAVRGRELGY